MTVIERKKSFKKPQHNFKYTKTVANFFCVSNKATLNVLSRFQQKILSDPALPITS